VNKITKFYRVLPFLSQPGFQEPYTRNDKRFFTNAESQLDLGKFLAYLDISAGGVAMHCAGIRVMTAAMESVAIRKRLTLDMDYELSVYPTKSWNKSLEICVEVSGNNGSKTAQLVDFYFTFVGVDDEGRPRQVREHSLQTPEEISIAEQAQIRKERYIESVKNPFTIEQITEEELNLVKNLQRKYCEQGEEFGSPVSATQKNYLDSAVLRDENLHKTIFGGYILDNSFNKAWLGAYDFIRKGLPLVAAINRVNFKSPINPGEIIRYVVKTIYTHETSIVQEVNVLAENKETKNRRKVNDCVFTMVGASGQERIKTALPKQVIPQSDEEITKWVESYRNQKQYKKSK
jgi:acyl-CoA hydrolase